MPSPEPASGQERFRTRRGTFALVLGVVGGPLLALGALHAMYPAVTWACRAGSELPLHLLALGGFALAVGFVWLARRDWRLAGGGWPGDEGGVVGRSRFLAAMGVLLSAFFALVVVAMWVPTLVFTSCQGS